MTGDGGRREEHSSEKTDSDEIVQGKGEITDVIEKKGKSQGIIDG